MIQRELGKSQRDDANSLRLKETQPTCVRMVKMACLKAAEIMLWCPSDGHWLWLVRPTEKHVKREITCQLDAVDKAGSRMPLKLILDPQEGAA